jgi:hypothetical protein
MSAQTDGSVITAGTTVSVNTGTVAVPVWTEVKGVRDIGGAGHDRPLIRATDLKDTVEKYALGRKDGTEITLTIREIFAVAALEPGQQELLDAYESGDPVSLKIAYPNTATREFDALVRSWPEAVNDGEFLIVEVGLKVVSDITRTEPAA